VTREIARFQARVGSWKNIETELEDLQTLAGLLSEEDDAELEKEFQARSSGLEKLLEEKRLLLLLNEEYDDSNAILSIHPGAGGLDSQDWAEMIFRMYLRWAEERGFQSRVLELFEDDEAGIKSATIHVSGDHAYGYLKSERGVHRLVRISPFDASGRRHTSFASVFV